MTLYQLELLISIADRGSISAAADFRGLSQPAVSHQIRLLEEELGVTLLLRKSRGMQLTEAGERVVDDGRQITEMVHAIPARAREVDQIVEGSLTLGLSPVSPVSTHHFPDIYQLFHQQYPRVKVAVAEGDSVDLVSRLHSREVDIAIMSLPILGTRINITPLWQEELVLVTNKAIPRPGRLIDFRDHSWIVFHSGFGLRQTLVSLCQSAGFDPKLATEVPTMGSLIGFVASGLGISLIPREAAVEHAQKGRIHITPLDPREFRTIALVSSLNTPMKPATHALASVIREYSNGPVARSVMFREDLPSTTI